MIAIAVAGRCHGPHTIAAAVVVAVTTVLLQLTTNSQTVNAGTVDVDTPLPFTRSQYCAGLLARP